MVKKILADGSPCKKCGEVLAKMEAEANNPVIESKASNFLDTTMLVNMQGDDDEPA